MHTRGRVRRRSYMSAGTQAVECVAERACMQVGFRVGMHAGGLFSGQIVGGRACRHVVERACMQAGFRTGIHVGAGGLLSEFILAEEVEGRRRGELANPPTHSRAG